MSLAKQSMLSDRPKHPCGMSARLANLARWHSRFHWVSCNFTTNGQKPTCIVLASDERPFNEKKTKWSIKAIWGSVYRAEWWWTPSLSGNSLLSGIFPSIKAIYQDCWQCIRIGFTLISFNSPLTSLKCVVLFKTFLLILNQGILTTCLH